MVFRVLWNVGAGVIHHAINKTPKKGLGVTSPVVWRARTGFLDCDLNMHLNNSSYLYCMELSRWHLIGYVAISCSGGILTSSISAIGAVPTCFKSKLMFLSASTAIRYRYPIPPFRAYDIQTQVVYWDDDWMYVLHRFVDPANGKLYAESVVRATIKSGKQRVSLHEFYKAATNQTVTSPNEMPTIIKELLNWDTACKSSMDQAQANELEIMGTLKDLGRLF